MYLGPHAETQEGKESLTIITQTDGVELSSPSPPAREISGRKTRASSDAEKVSAEQFENSPMLIPRGDPTDRIHHVQEQ